MSKNILNGNNVLVLNSLWQVIGITTVKQAIVALNSSNDGVNNAAKAINIVYGKNDNGTWNLENALEISALTFEEWLEVPIREGLDNVIRAPKISLRCPTVIVTTFSKMPMRKFRPTKNHLYDLQNGTCGYTGRKINLKSSSIEHKQPKSLGGKDTFENLMVVTKEINSKRGNKPLEEVGLIPLFYHREPKPIPISYTIKDLKHSDWKYFFTI